MFLPPAVPDIGLLGVAGQDTWGHFVQAFPVHVPAPATVPAGMSAEEFVYSLYELPYSTPADLAAARELLLYQLTPRM